MPTTRYGVSVRLNDMKRYAVSASASPVLSQRKRYGVTVENKLVVTKQYPLQLVAYSRRTAHEEDMQRATRREREFSASLFVRSASSGFDKTYDAERDIIEVAQGGTLMMEGVVDQTENVTNQQREWVAPLTTIEPTERRLDVEMTLQDSSETDLIPRERYIRKEPFEKSQRSTDSTAFLDGNEAAERQHIRNIQRDIEAISMQLRPVRTVELDSISTGGRIVKEYLTEKLELDGTDTPYIFVYEHQLYRTRLIQNIKPIDIETIDPMQRQTLPTDTTTIDVDSGKRVADVVDGHLTDAAALPRVNTTVSGDMTPAENVRVLEQTYLSAGLPSLDRASREMMEFAQSTNDDDAQLMHQVIHSEINDSEKTTIAIKEYDLQESAPDLGQKYLIEHLAESSSNEIGLNRQEETDATLSAFEAGTIERQWDIQLEDVSSAERHQVYGVQLLQQEQAEPVKYSRDALFIAWDTPPNERLRASAMLQEIDRVTLRTGYIEIVEDVLEKAENEIKYISGMFDSLYGAEMEAKAVEETKLERALVLEHEKEFMIDVLEPGDKSGLTKGIILDVADPASVESQVIEIIREEQLPGERPDRTIEIDRASSEHVTNVNNTIDGVLDTLQGTELTANTIEAVTGTLESAELLNNGFMAHLEQLDHGQNQEQSVSALLAAFDASSGQIFEVDAIVTEADDMQRSIKASDTHLADPSIGTKTREKEALTFDLSAANPSESASIGIWTESTQAKQDARSTMAYAEPFAQASRDYLYDDVDVISPFNAIKRAELNETYLHLMDQSERNALPVEESKYERVDRREQMYEIDQASQEQAGRENQQTNASLETLSQMSTESAQHDSQLDSYAYGDRAIIQDDGQLDPFDASEYVQKMTEIAESAYEQVEREKERETLRVETFGEADRMHQEITEMVETFGYADRMHEELTEVIETFGRADRHAEEMTELYTHDSAERFGNETVYLEHWTHADRYAYEETELAIPYYAAPTIKPIVLVEPEQANRNKMVYTEWEGYDHAGKTIKSGVLVDAEQADRLIKTLPTYSEDLDNGKMIIKTKKKIWLIPARGNHWNSWSGWKKTR